MQRDRYRGGPPPAPLAPPLRVDAAGNTRSSLPHMQPVPPVPPVHINQPPNEGDTEGRATGLNRTPHHINAPNLTTYIENYRTFSKLTHVVHS